MKKILRALAVLLTVALLAGVIAIVASAETTSQLDASQYGTGITNAAAFDMSNYEVTKNFCSVGGGKYKDGGATASFVKYASNNPKATITVGDETNTYYCIMNEAQETPAVVECTQYPFSYFFVDGGTRDPLSGKYDYATLDFDLAATGDGTYLEGAAFGPYIVKPDSYPVNIYTVSNDGVWYLSTNSTYGSGASIKISDEIGVWNHITYVFDIKGLASNKIPVYIYVNGMLLSEVDMKFSALSEIQRIRFGLSQEMANESYCYGIDNIAVNKYAVGYTSGEAYGIDDFIKDGAVGSPEIASDVVYQTGYTYTAAKDSQFYTVDGAKYVLSSDVIEAIEPGSVVEIARDLNIDVGGVNKFTLIAKNGANVAFGNNAGLFATTVISEDEGVVESEIKRIVYDAPAGVTTQAAFTYQDGSFGSVSTYLAYSGNFTANITSLGANRYIRFNDISTATLAKNALYRYKLVDNLGSTTEQLCSSYDYQVLDFDFSTETNYYDGMDFALYKNTSNTWIQLGYIYSDGAGGYVLSNNTSKTKTIPLSTEPNAWVHITAVISSADGRVDVYVNGEYFHTATNTVGEADRIERFEVFFHQKTTVHPFTLAIDNIIFRSYAKNYNSGASIFGLDDYKSVGDKTLPIYGLGDVVYGSEYGYDSLASVDTVASNSADSYYVPTGAFYNAVNGDTITLTKNVTLVSALPEGIETLNVTGAELILAGDAARCYNYTDGTLTKKILYNVDIYDENGEIAHSYQSDIALAPDVSAINISTSIKGNYNQSLAWSFKIGDGEAQPLSAWVDGVIGADEVVSLVPNTAVVLWYDNYGEMLDEGPEYWFVGSVASRDFEGLEDLGLLENGWYELEYYWTGSEEDSTNLTVVGDGAYFAAIRPVEAFTGLKVNYTLGSHYRCNYYVPVPMEDGVTVTHGKYSAGVTLSGCDKGYFDDIEECMNVNFDKKSADTTIMIGTEEYYKFVGSQLSAYTWYSANAFEVCFTVEYEGESYELSSKVALTRIGNKSESAKTLNYIDTVIKSTECGAGNEKSLVINWMRYINMSYKTQGNHTNLLGVSDILAAHEECGCLEAIGTAIPKEAPEYDVSEITDLMDGFAVGYRINHSAGRLVVYVPKAWKDANEGKELAITSTVYGMDNSTATIRNITYSFELQTMLDEENSTEDIEVYVPVVSTVNGVECYSYLMDTDFGIYNINAENHIAVSLDGEVVAEGNYSLAAYIYNLNTSLELYKIDSESGEYVLDETKLEGGDYSVDQLLFECALALAKLGEASYAYKLN